MSESGSVAELLADGLVRRLMGFDLYVREQVARRVLETLPPGQSVDVLAVLLRRLELGDGGVQEALAAIGGALSALGDLDAASAVYEEALARNRSDVVRFLMRPPPAKAFDPRQEHGVDHQMRARTIGLRRQMARTADPVLMVRLQTDPDPGVIRNLLQHPRLTEPEVVRMAARRPGRPEVLLEIFRSRRWSARQGVRKALASNPYTPSEVALKLVPLMPLPAIREIASQKELHEEVRRSARARLVEANRRRHVARAAANLAHLEPEGDA